MSAICSGLRVPWGRPLTVVAEVLAACGVGLVISDSTEFTVESFLNVSIKTMLPPHEHEKPL
jgi:hypothetical protein